MAHPDVIVYWRPGCMFCGSLLPVLEATDLTIERRNIWDDPADAAFVRSVAGGNETVPTVVVGDVALINPTAREVLRAVDPDADAAATGRGLLRRLGRRTLGTRPTP